MILLLEFFDFDVQEGFSSIENSVSEMTVEALSYCSWRRHGAIGFNIDLP
jgi:hypothetical protein